MAELTNQQRKALELNKHISVIANAGSGKTRVLVERYVEAIKDGVDVEQILCLTFTEKAALELRQKIVDRINSEFRAAGRNRDDASLTQVLRDARKKMLEANISTIHSFCLQVLREFPVEAGIDANFKVLEDFDAASLKEESCDKAIRELLAGEGSPGNRTRGSIHNFLVRVGYRRTLRLLVDLLNNREKIEHLEIAGKQVLLSEDTVRGDWSSLLGAVTVVLRENAKRKKGDFSSEADTLNDLLVGDNAELSNILSELKIVLEKILTQKGVPRKRDVSVEDGRSYSSEDALSILEVAFAALRGLPAGPAPIEMKEYLSLVETLMRLYERSDDNYSQKKYSMSALDFDDLQILTMRLLSAGPPELEGKNVRTILNSRFKQIMVDEFQDTNFLQYDIFLSLLDNFAGDAKLFVVGDPKQSIYRFRNAQVEVSRKVGEDLSGLADGVSLSLVESFRMNSDIAEFVNHIFASVMTRSRLFEIIGLPAVNQSDYDALKPRRPRGEENPIEIFISRKSSEQEEDEESENAEAGTGLTVGKSQAVFTAGRIRQMVDSGERLKTVKSGEEPKQIAYGDIAVLLRTRAKLSLLEEALTKYGVPYVVSSGIGFYSAQEVFDLTNYLTFLLDNSSDIDLLTVLRSPFFGISENELYRISSFDGGTLFARLRSFAASGDATDEVKYAASTLDDEIQLAQRLTIPQLINRILERSGWLGAYASSPTGDQRLANLRKLLSIAREFEGRGFNSLYDFVERIKYLKDAAREGQAPVEETVDAVKIMTVHAAKGLEFPVVVVPFCDATSNRTRSLNINDHLGVLPFFGIGVPPALSLYGKFEDMNEQAEVARLFYVATTRAMDKLILTTAAKKSGSPKGINSFSDIIAKTLDLSALPETGYYELPDARVVVHGTVPTAEQKPLERVSRMKHVGELFLDPIPADIDGEIYSATLLQTFRLCPTKYFLKYRLGMPAPESNVRRDEYTEYDDAILSTSRGELIHSVLQQAILDGKTDEGALREISQRVISSGLDSNLDNGREEKLLDQVVENAANAIATLKASSRLERVFVEQTITRKFGLDFLTGTLDLLAEDEKGYHIFDYKTNRLSKPLDEIYSEYEIQMRLYALLCGQLKPDQTEFDVTIIFTREAGKFLRKVYSRTELERFESELSNMLRNIKAIEPANGSFPHKNALPTASPLCKDCEYFIGGDAKECLLKREMPSVI